MQIKIPDRVNNTKNSISIFTRKGDFFETIIQSSREDFAVLLAIWRDIKTHEMNYANVDSDKEFKVMVIEDEYSDKSSDARFALKDEHSDQINASGDIRFEL